MKQTNKQKAKNKISLTNGLSPNTTEERLDNFKRYYSNWRRWQKHQHCFNNLEM